MKNEMLQYNGTYTCCFLRKMLISIPFHAILMKVCIVYQVVISKYHRQGFKAAKNYFSQTGVWEI